MKNILAFLLFMALVSACGGDSDNTTIPTPINTCANVSGFTVSQQNENILVNLTSSTTPLYYELSAVDTELNFGPDNGHIVTMNSLSESFTNAELGLNPGHTYLIYVRSACSSDARSGWSAAQTLHFNDFCGMPINLGVSQFLSGKGFTWESSDSSNSYYQVEYGPQGFTLGNGTSANTNGLYFIPAMAANTVYDFYVRAYCTNATGWSSWAGPYSYLSTAVQNLCSSPSNVTYTVNSGVGVTMHWNFNGESSFESTMVAVGASPNSGNIVTTDTTGAPSFFLSHGTYHFYVRAVCSSGNRTPWVGPKIVTY